MTFSCSCTWQESHGPTPLVLISDDEPLVVSALAREATRSGLTSSRTPLASTCSSWRASTGPRVIILDIHQHLDGRDLLAQLKQDPETRDCKVIVLTGVEDQFTRHVCFELGADGLRGEALRLHLHDARWRAWLGAPATPPPSL